MQPQKPLSRQAIIQQRKQSIFVGREQPLQQFRYSLSSPRTGVSCSASGGRDASQARKRSRATALTCWLKLNTLVERFVALHLVESREAKLSECNAAYIAQILRLRRDLGLNWVGAGMGLDMGQEIARLKARPRAA